MSNKSDYIVIGGGASGCAVTSSLLKSGAKVSLFEAGHSHHNFYLDIPSGFFKILNDNKYATYYTSSPQAHLGGRKNVIPQGNVLGGGTSINAQVYIRGGAEEYNQWNDELRINNDNIDWSWDSLLPYFKNMENNDRLNNIYHSQTGPLNVSDSSHINNLTHDFVKSVEALGVPLTNDFNGVNQKGVGFYQFMNKKGKRSSSAYAFIEEELKNKNLDLKLNSKIIKIIIENNKAIGVEYIDKVGNKKKQFANNEVILASGAFVTPKILMLSGIGSEEDLKIHNIKCIQNLPGVGKNLMDHPECIMIAKTNGKYGYYKQSSGIRMLKNGLQFLLFGTGMVNSTGVEAGVFINPLNEDEPPNLQTSFCPIMYMNPDTIGVVNEDYGVTISNVITKPKSRGYVKLKSNRFEDNPIIELNLLKEPEDLKLMIASQRYFLRLFKEGPLSEKIEKIVLPNNCDLTDLELEQHCKKFVKTNYHVSGTAKMGADNDIFSVLDAKMRVRGIDNLRVCDLSAMPIISSGNTSAPAMMLGARCADLILNY